MGTGVKKMNYDMYQKKFRSTPAEGPELRGPEGDEANTRLTHLCEGRRATYLLNFQCVQARCGQNLIPASAAKYFYPFIPRIENFMP